MKILTIDTRDKAFGRRSFFCCSALLFALVSSIALAGQDTWTGGGADERWSTPENWSGGSPPAVGDDVIMLGPGHLIDTANHAFLFPRWTLNSIQFPAAAPTFITHIASYLTIEGGLGSGIFNSSGRLQLIEVDPRFSSDLTGLIFGQSALAGAVQIENRGGNVHQRIGGLTTFQGNSSAGGSTINNFGADAPSDNVGAVFSGKTSFVENSTAGLTVIANLGGAVQGALGGRAEFSENASAGNATIHNLGATATDAGGGKTIFNSSATPGSATIVNDGTSASGGEGGVTTFASSSAENVTVTNNAGTVQGGTTEFVGGTAGNATVINNGSGPFGVSGRTNFIEASAGDATVVNNGGSVFLGSGGETWFYEGASAGNATLIANAGAPGSAPGKGHIPGGLGGVILFTENSTGGTSRVEVFGNGSVDISGHTEPGVTIGSLEGDGQAYLGKNNLGVGSSNTDTTFAGSLHDGGNSGGVGGSLTKVGSGTWTLSGTSDYTGASTVSSGKLLVDGSIASSSGVTVNAGATLGGHGVVSSIGGAGTIAPGNSPGILTATHLDPSGGTDFVFEFTKTGSPIYSNSAASGNDLLHLMDLVPFTTAFDSGNQITIDFSGATLADGQTYLGGFFTDAAVSSALLSDATFTYLGLNGFDVHFDGFVAEASANFASGTIANGRVLEFDIQGSGSSVPDWSPTALLFALAIVLLLGLHSLTTRQAEARLDGVIRSLGA